MSAMAKMLADIVLKEIPQEIRDAITVENLTRIQENITNTLHYYKNGLDAIAREQLEQREILERIEKNVGDSNSGKPARGTGGKRIAGSVDDPGTGD